jgi:hypothetical protein
VSAQIIDALRKRADVLDADAGVLRQDREVAWKYIRTVGEQDTVTPSLLRFLAAQFRAVADVAEGREPGDGHG